MIEKLNINGVRRDEAEVLWTKKLNELVGAVNKLEERADGTCNILDGIIKNDLPRLEKLERHKHEFGISRADFGSWIGGLSNAPYYHVETSVPTVSSTDDATPIASIEAGYTYDKSQDKNKKGSFDNFGGETKVELINKPECETRTLTWSTKPCEYRTDPIKQRDHLLKEYRKLQDVIKECYELAVKSKNLYVPNIGSSYIGTYPYEWIKEITDKLKPFVSEDK